MKKVIYLSIFLIMSKMSVGQKIGTMKDSRDGQTYRTITYTINGQQVTWMAENLNFDLKDASTLPGSDDDKIKHLGRIYGSKFINEICPAGWRIPSKNDWLLLMNEFLGEPKKHYSGDYWASEEFSPGGNSGFNLRLVGSFKRHSMQRDSETVYFQYFSTAENVPTYYLTDNVERKEELAIYYWTEMLSIQPARTAPIIIKFSRENAPGCARCVKN